MSDMLRDVYMNLREWTTSLTNIMIPLVENPNNTADYKKSCLKFVEYYRLVSEKETPNATEETREMLNDTCRLALKLIRLGRMCYPDERGSGLKELFDELLGKNDTASYSIDKLLRDTWAEFSKPPATEPTESTVAPEAKRLIEMYDISEKVKKLTSDKEVARVIWYLEYLRVNCYLGNHEDWYAYYRR